MLLFIGIDPLSQTYQGIAHVRTLHVHLDLLSKLDLREISLSLSLSHELKGAARARSWAVGQNPEPYNALNPGIG